MLTAASATQDLKMYLNMYLTRFGSKHLVKPRHPLILGHPRRHANCCPSHLDFYADLQRGG